MNLVIFQAKILDPVSLMNRFSAFLCVFFVKENRTHLGVGLLVSQNKHFEDDNLLRNNRQIKPQK